ncbi:MAG: succinate dehydrogenase [Gammaproteobacteria bacterium]|nr:succinate dehydrogenase [Gammaproteobacteria bacterium]
MSTRTEVHMWIAQRATAAVLAPAVIVHIVTIAYAVRGGLNAIEIIERVQGNIGWLLFYVVFVFAAAVHGALGLRTVLSESTALRGVFLDGLIVLFGVVMAALGWRAAFVLFSYGAT